MVAMWGGRYPGPHPEQRAGETRQHLEMRLRRRDARRRRRQMRELRVTAAELGVRLER